MLIELFYFRTEDASESFLTESSEPRSLSSLQPRSSPTPAPPDWSQPPQSPASMAASDKSTLKVFLPNGGFNVVKFGDATDIKGIIQLLTCRLGGGQRAFSHLYSMRLVNHVTGDIHCLHQDTTMYQVIKREK